MMEKEISLLQALSGVDFVIDFLDGTKFRVKNKPGEVIKPDSLMTIEGKGLPFHKKSYEFGNLFILFKIKFPDSLDSNQTALAATAFEKQKKSKADDDMDVSEVVNL